MALGKLMKLKPHLFYIMDFLRKQPKQTNNSINTWVLIKGLTQSVHEYTSSAAALVKT